jgi:hypothetical protein
LVADESVDSACDPGRQGQLEKTNHRTPLEEMKIWIDMVVSLCKDHVLENDEPRKRNIPNFQLDGRHNFNLEAG